MTVNVCVLELLVMLSTVRSADGAISSARATSNVPSTPASTKFPARSATWLARIETVYVPLSPKSHEPPGAVTDSVAVLGVPSL